MDDKGTIKFLQEQVKNLEEEHEHFMDFWSTKVDSKSEEIESLKEKIKAVQEELQLSKKREEEVTIKFNSLQEDLKNVLLQKVILQEALEEKEKESQKLSEQFQDKLNEQVTSQKHCIAEVLGNIKRGVITMNTDFDKKLAWEKEAARVLREKAEQAECDLDKVKVELRQKEENMKNQQMKEELRQKDAAFEEERKTWQEKGFQYSLKNKGLEKEIETLKQKIKFKSQENLPAVVARLKETVKRKDQVISNKNKDLASLENNKNLVEENFKEERKTTALLNTQIQSLQNDVEQLEQQLADSEAKIKDISSKHNSSLETQRHLIHTNTMLKEQLKSSGPARRDLKKETQCLKTLLLRVKEDLQASMSLIDDPKKLRDRIICLKRCYVDEEKTVPIDAETTATLQDQVNYLKLKNSLHVKTEENNKSEIQTLKKQVGYINTETAQIQSHYIKEINCLVMEVGSLKKELSEVTLQLIKAKKPVQQKVQSWVKKKILKTATVHPVDTEEAPNVPPKTGRPLAVHRSHHLDRPVVDNKPSSSSQLLPPIHNHAINKKGFIAISMPKVDI